MEVCYNLSQDGGKGTSVFFYCLQTCRSWCCSSVRVCVRQWPSDQVTKWPSDQVTDLPSDQVTEGFADDWPYGIFIEDKRVEMTNFFVWGCFLFLNDNKHLAWGWCNEIRSRTISNITPFWVGKFWYFWRLPILSDCFDVPDYVLCKYIQYEYFCKILIKVCSVGTSPPLQINCTKYDIYILLYYIIIFIFNEELIKTWNEGDLRQN